MIRDPIVDEVRAVRDAIAKEHGYDIDAIFEAFRRLEKTSGRTYVAPPVRKTVESREPASIEESAKQDAAGTTTTHDR